MKVLLISFLFASFIFLIVDILWLLFTVKSFYRPNLGSLLTDKPVMWASILFYLVYMIGLTILVLQPALDHRSVFKTFWLGIVFGVVAYGTYNLTNMATIKNWSINVVVVDMIWGGILTGSSSALSIYLTKQIYD